MHKNVKKAFVALFIFFTLGIFLFIKLPKPETPLDKEFNLMSMADGTCFGLCDNGLVKAEVEVDVHNHQILNVRIIKHNNGLGSAANGIIAKVVEKQSVEVEFISGATISSKTILKAIENALAKGEKVK